MELFVRCKTYAKRILVSEIALPCSNPNKQNADVSFDEDNLPLQLQEAWMEVAGVSEFERGKTVIANNRKKEEEIRKGEEEGKIPV
jgi:hypothetical protein